MKSNANYAESHIISFKSSELNSNDLSKKVPLLYETRQSEISENFRTYTTARIHFGQNVNILKENLDSSKTEKNLENAKINFEKPSVLPADVPTTSNGSVGDSALVSLPPSVSNAPTNINNSNSMLDVRVTREEAEAGVCILPVLGLSLDKQESLNSCNLYKSPKPHGQSTFSVNSPDKVYDKYLF